VLKSFEPQGISNQTKKDWHHDEAPQPPHILFNLQRTTVTLYTLLRSGHARNFKLVAVGMVMG